tara:strand:- start:1721 stop:1918 length:198 start_codon:yes stop_codon:yes gene_type:complete
MKHIVLYNKLSDNLQLLSISKQFISIEFRDFETGKPIKILFTNKEDIKAITDIHKWMVFENLGEL